MSCMSAYATTHTPPISITLHELQYYITDLDPIKVHGKHPSQAMQLTELRVDACYEICLILQILHIQGCPQRPKPATSSTFNNRVSGLASRGVGVVPSAYPINVSCLSTEIRAYNRLSWLASGEHLAFWQGDMLPERDTQSAIMRIRIRVRIRIRTQVRIRMRIRIRIRTRWHAAGTGQAEIPFSGKTACMLPGRDKWQSTHQVKRFQPDFHQ